MQKLEDTESQGHSKGTRQKKLTFLAGHSAKALTPSPLHYMFLKPANSDMKNGFFKNSKMSPKKVFERQQNNTATGVDYLT